MRFIKNLLNGITGLSDVGSRNKGPQEDVLPIHRDKGVTKEISGSPKLKKKPSGFLRKRETSDEARARRKNAPRHKAVVICAYGERRIIPLAQRVRRRILKARAAQRRERRVGIS